MVNLVIICEDSYLVTNELAFNRFVNAMEECQVGIIRRRPSRYLVDDEDCVYMNLTDDINLTYTLELLGFKVLNNSKFIELVNSNLHALKFADELGVDYPRLVAGDVKNHIVRDIGCKSIKKSDSYSYNPNNINQMNIGECKRIEFYIIDNVVVSSNGDIKKYDGLHKMMLNLKIDLGIAVFLVDKRGILYFEKFLTGDLREEFVDYYKILGQLIRKQCLKF